MEQKYKKFSEWHDITREKINWHPKIDEEKCAGCGMCVISCGRNIFDFEKKKNKSVVARPTNFMVGCTSSKVCVFLMPLVFLISNM